MNRLPNDIADFMQAHGVQADDPAACWIWQKAKSLGPRGGYGRFRSGGKDKYAHRYVYFLKTGGPLPRGREFHVMHTCNNKACVNPFHLELGTARQNIRSALSDGITASGERHPDAKLSDLDVRAIRESGLSTHRLSRLMGVSRTTVSRIKNNETRKWDGRYGAA